jgi:hypothetical protein
MGRRFGGAVAALGATAALGLASCGGSEEPPRAEPLGQKLGGSVATMASCRDWAGGPRDRKLATIADIRNQVSRDDAAVKAPPLSDAEALQLFDRECERSYAAGFRLYVLYARAAGWAPLLRTG